MRIEIASFIFAVQSIAFSVIEYDRRFKNPDGDEVKSSLLLNIISLMTLFLSKLKS